MNTKLWTVLDVAVGVVTLPATHQTVLFNTFHAIDQRLGRVGGGEGGGRERERERERERPKDKANILKHTRTVRKEQTNMVT